MKIKSILLLAFGIFILNSAFGQKKYYNSNYKLDPKTTTLSLIPIYNERASVNDKYLTKIFTTTAIQKFELITPTQTRQLIDSDDKLSSIINKIVLKEYQKKELKTFPNLNTILTNLEIDYLREGLNNSGLILIPIVFNIQVVGKQEFGGHTFGSTNFRMYDLNTGDFIFECPNNLNVNIGGEKGAESLTAALIGMMYECYIDYFIKE